MNLSYRHYGSSPGLVILHGLLGSSANWKQQGRVLGECFSVYIPDLRNHGQSPHADSMRIEDTVNDLCCFFETHDIGSAHLLGTPWGG